MKKLFSCIMVFAVALLLAAPSFASDNDLAYKGFNELETITESASGDLTAVYDASTDTVKKMDAANPGVAGDLTFQSDLLAIGRVGAASSVSSSSTALAPSSLPYTIILKSVGGASSLDASPGTTLQDGTPGQVLVLFIKNLMTGGTWLVTPTTSVYITSISFDTAGDAVTLLYVNDTIGWIILDNTGATITANTFSF